MITALSPRRAMLTAVVLVAVVITSAVALVLVGTVPNGPGLSVDSASYELAADKYRDAPVLVPLVLNGVFPPGYPAAIAAAQILEPDARDAALLVNLVCFAATIALVASAVWISRREAGAKATPASVAVVVAAASALAISPAMLRWTGYVMAELLSIALTVAAVVAASRGVRAAPRWFVAAGAAAGAAGIARHGALATVVAIAVVAPMLLAASWPARARAVCSVVLSAVVCWVGGTWLLLGGPPESQRAIVWHPPGRADVGEAVDTIASYWLPRGLGTDGGRAVVLGGSVALVVAITYVVRRRGWRPSSLPPATVFASAALVLHLVALVASKAWLDQAIVADDRLLLPLVPLTVLAVAAAWPASLGRRWWVVTAVGLAVVLGAQTHRSAAWVREARNDGIEYGHRRFASSETLAAVRALPDDVVVWTNEVSLLALRADRQAFPVPAHVDAHSGEIEAGFDAAVARLAEDLAEGVAVVFVDGFPNPRLVTLDELRKAVPGLEIQRFADGAVLRQGAP